MDVLSDIIRDANLGIIIADVERKASDTYISDKIWVIYDIGDANISMALLIHNLSAWNKYSHNSQVIPSLKPHNIDVEVDFLGDPLPASFFPLLRSEFLFLENCLFQWMDDRVVKTIRTPLYLSGIDDDPPPMIGAVSFPIEQLDF